MNTLTLTPDQVAAAIKQHGVVAILRGDYSMQETIDIAAALREGGVRILELTLNSPSALEGIGKLRELHGEAMFVGAGTVRTVEQVDIAIDAGAQFLVSPNFDPASVQRSRQRGVLHLPGVLTPSEAQQAMNAGCRMLKLFPSDIFGPSYLKALKAPLDDAEFVPTGGITPDNLKQMVQAGAVAIGAGSSLIPKKIVAGSLDHIREQAEAYNRAWRDAHA
ncbi:MAG: bifunctional 4-hydroxy-2-oxoglutarate aldolase/2-dehydro-3-deoxy-phosphogluconate aldolase [Anaerolineae bacterium]|nr:bifunctional 4-hydroxy-2-oxoglutarate aldolase/2-dehydro-3-deoxy-phosphogluconate aldolase [Anaerolineae bacterium]